MRVKLPPPIRVALVDDHPVVQQAIAHLLQGAGFHICMMADDGQLFLDALEGGAEPPDICLLDVSMPVLDGFQTAQALHKCWPSIKILAASFDNRPAVILEMLRCGAVGYLLKDGEPEEWMRAIKAVYAIGSYFGPLLRGCILNHFQAPPRVRKSLSGT